MNSPSPYTSNLYQSTCIFHLTTHFFSPILHNMDMNEVIKGLGGTCAVAKIIGVSPQAVSNWKARGKLPPQWHLKIYKLCREKGWDYDPDE